MKIIRCRASGHRPLKELNSDFIMKKADFLYEKESPIEALGKLGKEKDN